MVYAAKKKDAIPTSEGSTTGLRSDVSSAEVVIEDNEERTEKKMELSICDDKECNLAVKVTHS